MPSSILAFAGRFQVRVSGLLLILLLFSATVRAQELWPGMEKYVKMTLSNRIVNGTPEVDLINIYSSPLVAITSNYRCTNPHYGGHSEKRDVALTFSTPIMPDQTVHMASAWTGCTGGITALIFADGKEIGDPAVLRRLHDCRTVSWEELHRTLEEDIFAVPASEWDSEQSVAKLKERRAGFVFPMKSDDENAIEMQSCRATEIDCIIASVEDYRSSVARYPDKFQGRKGLYLQQLKDWDQTLQSFSYPARPTWWKRGVIFYAPSKKQQAALPDPVSQVSKARPGAPIY